MNFTIETTRKLITDNKTFYEGDNITFTDVNDMQIVNAVIIKIKKDRLILNHVSPYFKTREYFIKYEDIKECE